MIEKKKVYGVLAPLMLSFGQQERDFEKVLCFRVWLAVGNLLYK